jgi:hypothetical protein
MSIQMSQSNAARVRRELADLQKRQSDETKKEVDRTKRIAQIQSNITRTTTPSMLQMKQRDISRLAEEISRIQATKAHLGSRIARKTEELHRYEQELLREQERERKRVDDAERRRQQQQIEHQRALTRELAAHRQVVQELRMPTAGSSLAPAAKTYDLFISHATEDKDDFVRPLAKALEEHGVRVWYDETELKVGDSLRRSIHRGLANSRYGVVVLSSAFFAKNWPQYELDGLVAREMSAGSKVVLPIWHKISKDEVLSFSPSLADKVALNTSLQSVSEIAKQLAEVARPGDAA